jgi:hypothetical protein
MCKSIILYIGNYKSSFVLWFQSEVSVSILSTPIISINTVLVYSSIIVINNDILTIRRYIIVNF